MAVYEDPQTMFVAGFIGSPAMNFLPGRADGGSRIALDHGGTVSTSLAALGAKRQVMAGIRPEHLVPCGDSDAQIKGSVELVEQLGADALVHVAHGGSNVIARVAHAASPLAGSTFCMKADPGRVFVFDPENGARVH
jgi:ABC-type sugar transport system ATPase subunit